MGRGTPEHAWRVFADGKEYIVKNVIILVPSKGEKDENGQDWNITADGSLTIDRDTSTITIS
jgi:hypothetical protein